MRSVVHVLLIDNFDSFTFNLVDALRSLGATVTVWRNDIDADKAFALAQALPEPRLCVLSPGPGNPTSAGCSIELVRRGAGSIPLFGVCLGLQVIVEALGGRVAGAGSIVHGKSVSLEHDGGGIFSGLPMPMRVGRYHSLAAVELPEALRVTARYVDPGGTDVIMAVSDTRGSINAVQFHPESILTPSGTELLANVLNSASESRE